MFLAEAARSSVYRFPSILSGRALAEGIKVCGIGQKDANGRTRADLLVSSVPLGEQMATYTSGNAWDNGGTFSTPGTINSMSSMRFARYDHQWSIYLLWMERCARSHSVGEVPMRWVKTRVRAVGLVYPAAVAMSLRELPLRSMVWATPRRQSVR